MRDNRGRWVNKAKAESAAMSEGVLKGRMYMMWVQM
jgi:hypothetical protein